MREHKYELEKSVIDLEMICGCIKRYWWLLILALVLSMGIALSNIFVEPSLAVKQYSASAMIYVGLLNERSAAPNSVALMNSQVPLDYLNEALLQNQMVTVEEGRDTIHCEQIKNSDYITLQATGTSLERETFIVEYLVEDFLKGEKGFLLLEDCWLVGDISVSVIETESGFDRSSFFIIVAFGVMAGSAILVLIMLFSDKIWSSFDIIQCFGDTYWGCYPAGDHEWTSILMRQNQKHAWQNLCICYGTSKPQAVRMDLTQFMPDNLHAISLDELDCEHIPEHIAALLIIKNGVSSYKNIDQTLVKLRGLDIEIAGCIYIS